MKGLIRGGAPMLGMAMLLTAIGGNAAAQGQPGNDSADWCVVSAGACAGKDKTVSVTQGETESFTGRLISPDKLNAGASALPINAYLAAGEWSSYCGETVACGVNPTVVITPSMLTFTGFAQAQDFSVQVVAGANVVPGEYTVKIKTFGPDNEQLRAIGWGLGSGLSLTIMVTEAGSCAPPTLSIISPAEGASFAICQVNATTLQGATPVAVSLEASSGITDFSAVISRADGSNPSAVTLVKTLAVDPATASGTGSANGTIGSYKVTATATNACATVTQMRSFAVNYVFDWLPPTPSTPSASATVPTKFSIRDCAGAFVADETVQVTISNGIGFSATHSFGANPNTGVTISTVDEVYHTNFELPAGQGVEYTITVKFQGIQQGPARTFTTKATGPSAR
jgi:hypothetical protein